MSVLVSPTHGSTKRIKGAGVCIEIVVHVKSRISLVTKRGENDVVNVVGGFDSVTSRREARRNDRNDGIRLLDLWKTNMRQIDTRGGSQTTS